MSDRCCGPTITNFGIGSQTTTQILSGVTTALASSPDFILIQGGVNDIASAVSDPNATIQSNIATICDAAVLAGATPILVNISPWKGSGGWTADRQTWTDTYNAWLAGYATANGYQMADVYAVLEDPANPDTLLPAFDSDHIHPNTEGYKIMGLAVSIAVQNAGPW